MEEEQTSDSNNDSNNYEHNLTKNGSSDATRINEEPGTRSDPDGENEEIENDNNTDRSTQDSGNQDGEDEDDGQSTRSKKDGSTSGSEDSDEDQEDGPSACSYEDELKPLWAGNLQYMKLDRTEPFQPNECFDLIENSTVINNFVPKKLPLDGSGSIVFLVSADTFKNGKDVGFDSLRPWRGKDKDGQLVAPKIDKDMIGGRWFKTIRATHHDNRHIRKLQRYWMDEKGLPTSPVLHQYMFLADGIELPKQESRVFTLPSARDEINEALSHRTTTAAKKYLAEEGIEFKPKTVTKLASNHPTVIKQGSGPRVATDVEKLREMRKSNPNILIHEGKENGEGNDEDLRVICTFPEVISLFLHSCPTGTQIKQHRIEMSELEKMDDDATESFLETLTRRKTVSQTIPKMGSHAQSDTTFEVSHLLLTIVVGVIDNFVTKTSGKSSSAVLAIMLHPSKEERHHEALGKAIEGQMKIIAPHRRVPAYVTDGEKSLQAIAKGQAFELSARLGCDLHKKGNLIDKFGKILGETLAPALFGKKAESDDGFIYARGILGMCQRSRFDEEIAKLTTVHPRLHKWVNHRKEDLWTRHSLRAKLDGGFLAQYLTSNIVEQRNQELKLHLKSRCPGEVVLELFLQKDKLEVDKFLGAVAGGSSSVRLANHVANQYRSEEEWTGLTCVQKKAHLAPFGIDFRDEITEMVTGAVPAWIFKGFSPARKEEFAHSVTKLKVYDLDDFFLVKFPNDSGSNVEVKRERGLLECTGMCRMNKKTAACEHIVAVLMFLDVDKRATALDVLTRKEQNKTEKQILASSIQKEDGGKGGRKSGDFSKSNVGRTEKRFTTFDFSASLRGKRGAADEGAAGTSSDAIPSKRAAPDNGEITDIPPVRSRRERPVVSRSLFTPTHAQTQ